jgi:hypothetical protein
VSGPPPIDINKNRFVYPSQMNAIAKFVSRLGMIDDIEVRRRTPNVDPAAPANAYGDDSIDFVPTQDSRRHWVKGWVYSTPATVQEVDSGAIITVNTYVLRVPIGTDILAGDEVFLDPDTYTVSSINDENTWKVLIDCNLRKRE